MEGGPAPTREAFFSDPAARARYKSRLRYLVARWGYSPSIGAWEFFNEVDNVTHGREDVVLIPHADVVRWHAEMGTYLKAIDPYGHLVTTSISHRDIPGLNDIAPIDFNQKHVYRDTNGIPDILTRYLERHGKPYVVGSSRSTGTGIWTSTRWRRTSTTTSSGGSGMASSRRRPCCP